MPSKKHKPEEIIGKLGEVEIVLSQGATTGNDVQTDGTVFQRDPVGGDISTEGSSSSAL